jgi:hypothetical protein
MLIDIIESIKARITDKVVSRVLSENLFENKDVGPINEIGTVSKFVISIPKCATTALQRGFERIGHPVIHAHNNTTTYEAFANGDLLRRARIDLETLVRFRRNQSKEPIHFFFGYREPVSWYLSLAGHFGMALTENLSREIDRNIRYAYPWNKYEFRDTQKIVERASGIRLFTGSFDNHAGYTVLRRRNIHVILYRADRMRDVEGYIKENIDYRFEMSDDRVNLDPSYMGFIERFRLPAQTLLNIYSSNIFAYFYDRSEAAQLIAKYVSPGTSG